MGRQILLLDIGAALSIVGEVSHGEVGLPWAATFRAAGGFGGYSWAIAAGAVPAGAEFDAADDVANLTSAELEAAGTYTFSVRLTDNLLRLSTTRAFTVVVTNAYAPLEFLLTESGDRLVTESGAPLLLEV